MPGIAASLQLQLCNRLWVLQVSFCRFGRVHGLGWSCTNSAGSCWNRLTAACYTVLLQRVWRDCPCGGGGWCWRVSIGWLCQREGGGKFDSVQKCADCGRISNKQLQQWMLYERVHLGWSFAVHPCAKGCALSFCVKVACSNYCIWVIWVHALWVLGIPDRISSFWGTPHSSLPDQLWQALPGVTKVQGTTSGGRGGCGCRSFRYAHGASLHFRRLQCCCVGATPCDRWDLVDVCEQHVPSEQFRRWLLHQGYPWWGPMLKIAVSCSFHLMLLVSRVWLRWKGPQHGIGRATDPAPSPWGWRNGVWQSRPQYCCWDPERSC